MEIFGKTDIGKKRSVNQDSFLTTEYTSGISAVIVCDGMGGVRGGAEASSTAAESFSQYLNSFVESHLTEQSTIECTDAQIHRVLRTAAAASNEAVYHRAEANEELRGMGTTLVATLVVGTTLYTVNVGDSRMYLFRDGETKQITHDHSYVQYLVDIGRMTKEEALTAQNRNIITRAVGTESSVDADVFVTELDASDSPIYALLCSDGLTNHLSEDEIATIVTSDAPLPEKADALITEANEKGGSDNITAVLIRF